MDVGEPGTAERSLEAVLCSPDGSHVTPAGGLYREEGDGGLQSRVTRDGTLAQPWLALRMEEGTMG